MRTSPENAIMSAKLITPHTGRGEATTSITLEPSGGDRGSESHRASRSIRGNKPLNTLPVFPKDRSGVDPTQKGKFMSARLDKPVPAPEAPAFTEAVLGLVQPSTGAELHTWSAFLGPGPRPEFLEATVSKPFTKDSDGSTSLSSPTSVSLLAEFPDNPEKVRSRNDVKVRVPTKDQSTHPFVGHTHSALPILDGSPGLARGSKRRHPSQPTITCRTGRKRSGITREAVIP